MTLGGRQLQSARTYNGFIKTDDRRFGLVICYFVRRDNDRHPITPFL
jgi:hypothetical protein